jgi:hypothetical protein
MWGVGVSQRVGVAAACPGVAVRSMPASRVPQAVEKSNTKSGINIMDRWYFLMMVSCRSGSSEHTAFPLQKYSRDVTVLKQRVTIL